MIVCLFFIQELVDTFYFIVFFAVDNFFFAVHELRFVGAILPPIHRLLQGLFGL